MIHFLRHLGWPIACALLLAIIMLERQNAKPASEKLIETTPVIESFADAVAKASHSVVNIYTQRPIDKPQNPLLDDPFFQELLKRSTALQQQRNQQSLGSGVIIQEQYILTNQHVISDATQIVVSLQDGRSTSARLVGSDTQSDLAVLAIDLPSLTPITAGDLQATRIGDILLAIGNPFGIGQTVTQGILSATGRHGLHLNTYENFLQTDAAINRGSSGGALINTKGELIGINSAIYTPDGNYQGIALATPVDLALRIAADLIEHGKVMRGWLGIEVQNLETTTGEHGIMVTATYPKGPADQAGLKPRDIITHIDDHAVIDGNSAMHSIAAKYPGDEVSLQILREGKSITLSARVTEHPAE